MNFVLEAIKSALKQAITTQSLDKTNTDMMCAFLDFGL